MYEGFKIDSDVPPPRERTYPQQKYPFDEMEVGDSFFVPALPGIVSSPWDRLYNALYRWQKKRGNGKWRFVIRRRVEAGNHGARVWRMK